MTVINKNKKHKLQKTSTFNNKIPKYGDTTIHHNIVCKTTKTQTRTNESKLQNKTHYK